jgi:hypothetical protein
VAPQLYLGVSTIAGVMENSYIKTQRRMGLFYYRGYNVRRVSAYLISHGFAAFDYIKMQYAVV